LQTMIRRAGRSPGGCGLWVAGCVAAAWLLAGCQALQTPGQGAPAVVAGAGAATEPLVAAGWVPVHLPGKRPTDYRQDLKEGRLAWFAHSEASASMVRKRLQLPPQQLGMVEFSWWVDRLVPGADLSEAGQGDSPARVVFAFDGDHGRLSMKNRMLFELATGLGGEPPPFATLMYVWANDAEPESVIINPRTDRIRKIVVESGAGRLQQWRTYRRDLAADYRRAFGEEPGPLLGVAYMTDSDNMSASARTWYGEVQLGASR
jgi:Protein of unknown function (DUF3047)